MEALILLVFGAIMLVGFVGGIIGGRIGRRKLSEDDDNARARIEQRLDHLQRVQSELARRLADLDALRDAPPAAAAAPPHDTAAAAPPYDTAAAAPPHDTAAAAPLPAFAVEAATDTAPTEFDFDLPEPAAPARPTAPTPPAASAPRRPLAAPTVLPEPPTISPPALPEWLRHWLFGGNLVVRIGIVILFFGVAFLLKFAYEHVHVPIELRLSATALGAIALLGLGWRLRTRRVGYALALQGGGIGVLYLVVFAALRLYELIPAPAAFALLAAIAVCAGILALLQDGRSLAVLGTAGGFLAPILASTGSGSHVALFSYYALLNAGVLALAWRRTWRELNLLGFAFTFVIATLWGAQYYRAELFASVEPFLLLFFLMYVAVPVGYALRSRAAEANGGKIAAYLDGTLVFGTPLVAFGLQLRLVSAFEYGAAFSALALGIFYLALARLLWARTGQHLRLLLEAFLALGVVFATLAIPLAFEGRWTAAAWALESAAILWMGLRQRRLGARAFAILLQLGAGAAFMIDLPGAGTLAVLNAQFLGCALIAAAGLFSAWLIHRHGDIVHPLEWAAAPVLLGWGLLWWGSAGVLQIDGHLPAHLFANSALLFAALSAVALATLARRTAWAAGNAAAVLISPLLAIAALAAAGASSNPLAALGWLAWPTALGAHLYALRGHDEAYPRAIGWLHALGVWVLALVAGVAAARAIDGVVDGASSWAVLGLALVPGAVLAALVHLRECARWPLGAQRRAYLLHGGAPVAAFLLLWAMLANIASPGHADPLPYLPLLNPLEIGLTGALLLCLWWYAGVRRAGLLDGGADAQRTLVVIAGLCAFALANGVLLRSLHHFAAVPWALDALASSRLVHAALALFWTAIALAVMLLATRRGLRPLWMAGAALMAVVVVKLFLIDLSNIGGIERVVSFLGVGVLMLVIGWFTPVPPKTTAEQQ